MSENLEKIKIGLLSVVCVVMIVNTYYVANQEAAEVPTPNESPTGSARGNSKAANNNANLANPAATQFNPNAAGNTNGTPVTANPTANPAITASTDPTNPLATPAAPSGPKTAIQFAGYDHSFGSINQDTENKHVFKFTNNGDEPLVIENAKGSCGCTVPNYPKHPIMPGKVGEIEVIYRPAKQKGPQQKTITVTANTDPANTILKISADVQEI
jgi:hypothetical protein